MRNKTNRNFKLGHKTSNPPKGNRTMFQVTTPAPGYVVVRRPSDNATICAGRFDPDTLEIRGLEFMRPEYRKCNATRLAAVQALKREDYR